MTKKYTITGIVQGIGFRPNVKRAAEKYCICGYVKNLGGAVEVLAQGVNLEQFKEEIKSLPQSLITSFKEETAEEKEYAAFTIIESGREN
ncbi:MAG: acylphosphatase, partial [Clostridia bacterium]|nr:acylphosphatase [Clostridia bacterium]